MANETPLSDIRDNPIRVIVFDHTPELREAVATVLRRRGYDVHACERGREALALMDQHEFEVMVTNASTTQASSSDFVAVAKSRWPSLEVVMVSGAMSLDTALEAIQQHVYEVLEIPIDIARLERTVRNAADHARMAKERERLLNELNRQNEQLERQVRNVTRELREKSFRDELTGLYNYRHFTKTFETELSRVQRYERSLSLVMMDLDHFKKLNDTLGHQKGNEVLAAVAQVLSDGCRSSDYAVRYGGEEFALILPETSKLAAKHIVDRIRIGVEELKVCYTTKEGEDKTVTISSGIAAAPEDGLTPDALIRQADAALYQAKASGRNCIVLAS